MAQIKIKKNKKSQAGQIFVYLLAVIIAGLILLYGYNAIKSFRDQGKELEFLELQKKLSREINLLETRYGSVNIIELRIPDKYDELCFVSSEAVESKDVSKISEEYSLVKLSVQSGTNDNTFLFPEAESWNAGNIKVDKDFKCFPISAGKLSLRLEGLGNKVHINSSS